MVNIYYDVVNDEIIEVAHMISKAQKTDVTIITPTDIVEVRYEEVSQGSSQENEEKETECKEVQEGCNEGESETGEAAASE